MTEDRLSDLSVLSIEKELAQTIDLIDIIDKFDAKDKTDGLFCINDLL